MDCERELSEAREALQAAWNKAKEMEKNFRVSKEQAESVRLEGKNSENDLRKQVIRRNNRDTLRDWAQ